MANVIQKIYVSLKAFLEKRRLLAEELSKNCAKSVSTKHDDKRILENKKMLNTRNLFVVKRFEEFFVIDLSFRLEQICI